MKCLKCGNEVEENVTFCPNCGTLVSKIESEASVNENVDANKINIADKVKKRKFDWRGVIGAILIFAWNSYAIVHNFCIHDGYFWAILGILINVLIILGAPTMITDSFPKFNPKIGYAILGAIFIIGAIVGFKPFESYIEESSIAIVNNILEENLGASAAECTDVTILKETGKYMYKGKAYLDNGNTLDVNIEYYQKTKQIEVKIPHYFGEFLEDFAEYM